MIPKGLLRRHGELVTLDLMGTATKRQRRELEGVRRRMDDYTRREDNKAYRRLSRGFRSVRKACVDFLDAVHSFNRKASR